MPYWTDGQIYPSWKTPDLTVEFPRRNFLEKKVKKAKQKQHLAMAPTNWAAAGRRQLEIGLNDVGWKENDFAISAISAKIFLFEGLKLDLFLSPSVRREVKGLSELL